MLEARDAQIRWREYARTRSARLREDIIRDYAILARRAVERLQISPWGCVSQEDLISHAVIGLIDAVDRYDPNQGVPFEGFAMSRIRGAVLDALRRLDWVPRTVRSEETRLRRAYGRLESILGRAPTDEEVADELGISLEQLEDLVTEISRSSMLSLDDLLAGATDSAARGEEMLSTDRDNPQGVQEKQEARRRLAEALDALPEREKLVVTLYYYHELTLKEIGRVIQVTEQRVSQIHTKAMLRLSHKLLRHSELVSALAA